MSNTACDLLVFARTPVAGQVKTRLIPVLGAEGAARLYERFLLRTLETAVGAAPGRVQLWCTPTTDHPFLERCAREFDVKLRLQSGRDLGERMDHALSACIDTGAVLVGCDCPELTVEDLESAASWLSDGTPVVLGPSEDGGYYLIGLCTPVPGLFEDVHWGRPSVLEVTRARLRDLGLRWRELPTRWDVDRPADLERLANLGSE